MKTAFAICLKTSTFPVSWRQQCLLSSEDIFVLPTEDWNVCYLHMILWILSFEDSNICYILKTSVFDFFWRQQHLLSSDDSNIWYLLKTSMFENSDIYYILKTIMCAPFGRQKYLLSTHDIVISICWRQQYLLHPEDISVWLLLKTPTFAIFWRQRHSPYFWKQQCLLPSEDRCICFQQKQWHCYLLKIVTYLLRTSTHDIFWRENFLLSSEVWWHQHLLSSEDINIRYLLKTATFAVSWR